MLASFPAIAMLAALAGIISRPISSFTISRALRDWCPLTNCARARPGNCPFKSGGGPCDNHGDRQSRSLAFFGKRQGSASVAGVVPVLTLQLPGLLEIFHMVQKLNEVSVL